MFAKHVTRDISAYCHGELPAEESRRFAEHIIACAKCRREFEEIKLGIKFAEQLPQLSAPEGLWQGIEAQLGEPAREIKRGSWHMRAAAVAAVLFVVVGLGVWAFWDRGLKKDTWQVQQLAGAPRIGSERITKTGRLGKGEWLETDESSRAKIAVGTIGTVEIDENTRVRLVATDPTDHRLELARGKMSAVILAPPRLFFVNTPSAVAADLGCAYTLEVDDHGVGLLRVTAGWVALELKERQSIVPAEAACETRPEVGPGTPYFEDASPAFRDALKRIDFQHDAAVQKDALTVLLNESRPRDTLTLWHLLARVNETDRPRVYEALAKYVPLPPGVTREGVLQLDRTMLERWKNALPFSQNFGGKGKLGPKKLMKLK
ncbi:MAG TPA: zf-HC2 domain-containing protein [Pyrinomonadaceae bacterium]